MSRKTTNYKITVPDNDDFIDIETVSNAIEEFDNILFNVETNAPTGTGAGFHSSIYRGAYLGDVYTDAQKEAISRGSFDGLFVGDYWTIDGVNWRIADFDYYYNVGDTSISGGIFYDHHVIIVPDTVLYDAQMNTSVSTSYAYSGSTMHNTNLNNAKTAFTNAFGSRFIAMHRCLYSNSVSNGVPDGWAWRYAHVELMSEEQVYGHAIWGKNGYDVGTQKTQFKLFSLDPTKINIKDDYWLTNVATSSEFAYMTYNGEAYTALANNTNIGVRPFACLVGDSE